MTTVCIRAGHTSYTPDIEQTPEEFVTEVERKASANLFVQVTETDGGRPRRIALNARAIDCVEWTDGEDDEDDA